MTNTKLCTGCRVDLPLAAFGRNATGAGGLRSRCKPCSRAYYKDYYAANRREVLDKNAWQDRANPASVAARGAKWRAANRGYATQWRAANPGRVKEQAARHAAKYPEKCAARVAKRRAKKHLATPAWSDADAVAGMYELAALFRKTGLRIEVDHIVPLQSELVCGLHTHDNLQLLAESENARKGNRVWPDMP